MVAVGSHDDRAASAESRLQPVRYRNPGLTVDLGVGLWAWPMPIDYDRDGDFDLVVSCPDVPYQGTYFFENPGDPSGSSKLPVFKPARKIATAFPNVQVSYVAGEPRVLVPGGELTDFLNRPGVERRSLGVAPDFHTGKIRANQWRLVDFHGDGPHDLIVGVGDWSDYGWDNAFNERGEWTRGPLHGYIDWARNTGTDAEPTFASPARVATSAGAVDVYGMPSPNFADFDADGDLDLICGEDLVCGNTAGHIAWIENLDGRSPPRWVAPRKLEAAGRTIRIQAGPNGSIQGPCEAKWGYTTS